MTTPEWKQLAHAQGPATRIPAQIKKLTASVPLAREEAFYQLAKALVAPGAWYSASGPAADLLAKQAASGKATSELSLRLLGEMAAGDHSWFTARDAPVRRSADKLSAETLRAATAVIPAAESMLRHGEPGVRAAAAFFLGLVPGGGDAAPALSELARRDPSIEVRATATVTLGFLARAGQTEAAAQLGTATVDDRLLTAALWAARIIAGAETTPDEDAAGAAGWFSERGTSTPWCSVSDSARWIAALVPDAKRRAFVAPAIVKAFVASGGEPIDRRRAIGELALELAGFKATFNEMDVAAAEQLDDGQRQTAAALMEMPDVVLSLRWGLPGSNRCMGKWLGLAPPSPLEELDANGQRRWQRVRAAIAAQRPFADVIDEAMADLSPRARLEVAQELLMGAYKILLHANGKITPAALEELAVAAGEEGVTWATQLVAFGAAARRDLLDVFLLNESHFLVAFKLLLRAQVSLQPEWDDAIGIEPLEDARLVFEAISPERRTQLLLRRLDRSSPPGQGVLIRKTMPLVDLVGSRELLDRYRQLMASHAVSASAGQDVPPKLAALA